MAPASHGLLGRIQRANDDASHRFGPHTAEVEAFIVAAAQLTPWQWRQVLAVRRLVASVSKEGAPDSARSIQAAIRTSDRRISEPIARAGEVLFDTLVKKSDDKQVAAWQAMTAIVMRSQLPALKFAVNYAPFAALIPLSGSDVLDPKTRRFMARLEDLTREQLEVLAQRWRIEPAASRTLLQAVAKNRHVKSEEAVAIAALSLIPNQLTGDQGWAAVRTAVHAGRVLGTLADLTEQEITELWAPIESVISLASLSEVVELPASARVRAAVGSAIKTITRPPRSRAVTAPVARAAAPYGPNHAEVAAFIKGAAELSPIQWLRVLDRRKLVSSVTREGAAEPAGVVRSILAMLEGTRDLDSYLRCRAFVAVERAGFALEARGHLNLDQVREVLTPFEASIAFGELNGGGFAHKVASLDKGQWHRIASAAPDANEEAVAPLVNAGIALIDFFGGRSDDEAVAAWHAVSALVHRHRLTPIKFAASYAPFASAIPVTNPRSLGAMVSRYVTAVGRLGASQCAVLAQPWQIDDALSSVLSSAVADGGSRAGEEAAALNAVVTVPMRLAGGGGWAAVKTAAFGGRVIAIRSRLTVEQLVALWAPIQPAIPLVSLNAPARARR
ncbi:MAG: hypothetical protein E6I71_00670 [Chloroflexi bacterium]|nr:MAG: hypothetical protein E6I71_00670 [Chloroflexota bacterium]